VRTTLTLEKDVAARLDQVVRRRRLPLKTVVNEALRVGLSSMEAPLAARVPFRTAGFDAGTTLVGSLDNIEEVLSRVEGDDHR